MKYLLFISASILGLRVNAVAQTYCLNYDILSLTATQVVVKVSVSGSTTFNLGDANLVWNFNSNALSAPSLVSTTVTNRFSPPTVTNPANGIASINLDYNGGVGQGLAVATTPTEIAQIQFTIINSTLTTGFSVNTNFSAAYKTTNPPTYLNIGPSCSVLDVTIPLEWLDFQARATTDKGVKSVNLAWSTASEQNIQHFIVERSADNQHYEKIGVPVKPNNTAAKSSYQVTDSKPLSGISFYRVREVDFDGKESFSVIRSVIFKENKPVFTIYPNPKHQGGPLSIQTDFNENYTFNLYDATGKRLYSRRCKGAIELNDVDLTTGFYIYECVAAQGKMIGKMIGKMMGKLVVSN